MADEMPLKGLGDLILARAAVRFVGLLERYRSSPENDLGFMDEIEALEDGVAHEILTIAILTFVDRPETLLKFHRMIESDPARRPREVRVTIDGVELDVADLDMQTTMGEALTLRVTTKAGKVGFPTREELMGRVRLVCLTCDGLVRYVPGSLDRLVHMDPWADHEVGFVKAPPEQAAPIEHLSRAYEVGEVSGNG